MKILVLGCNGMAGHMVSLYFKKRGDEVVGFAREDLGLIPTILGDAEDAELVVNIVKESRFDAVINCIGILNKEAEIQKARAAYLNAYLPHLLADITEHTITKIVHISTDCVFSGHKGNYAETDFRDGETFYSRSKALGELEDDKNITIRTSIIGPSIKENGKGLMDWFLQQKGTVYGYTEAIWTGQTTLQLSKTIEFVLQENICGLHNMVPDKYISKHDLLCLINKIFCDNKIVIEPSNAVQTNKSLLPPKGLFNYKIPGYEQMLWELREWMVYHRTLYRCYDMSYK